MKLTADILIGLVALIHLYILVLEMFLWTKPKGRRAFGLTEEFAQQTKVLAANLGLYNGFLAAGLIWGLVQGQEGFATKVFFLGCVLVAGIFGAISSNKKILFIQGVPALIALLPLLVAQY